MATTNLAWAIVWGLVFVLCVVGIFWNPAHFITTGIAGIFCAMYVREYVKDKHNK